MGSTFSETFSLVGVGLGVGGGIVEWSIARGVLGSWGRFSPNLRDNFRPSLIRNRDLRTLADLTPHIIQLQEGEGDLPPSATMPETTEINLMAESK